MIRPTLLWRELPVALGFGAFLAAIGAFDTETAGPVRRTIYWVLLLVIAEAALAGASRVIVRSLPQGLRRALAVWILGSICMAPVVWLTSAGVFGAPLAIGRLAALVPGVALIFGSLQFLTAVVRPKPLPAGFGRLPGGVPQAFRDRLPFQHRGARIEAVEAQDHYVRVHTDRGQSMIRMSMAEALAHLDAAEGFRTHRSWWVAAEAVDHVVWRAGRGKVRLRSGIEAPVSRAYAAGLRRADLSGKPDPRRGWKGPL